MILGNNMSIYIADFFTSFESSQFWGFFYFGRACGSELLD